MAPRVYTIKKGALLIFLTGIKAPLATLDSIEVTGG